MVFYLAYYITFTWVVNTDYSNVANLIIITKNKTEKMEQQLTATPMQVMVVTLIMCSNVTH